MPACGYQCAMYSQFINANYAYRLSRQAAKPKRCGPLLALRPNRIDRRQMRFYNLLSTRLDGLQWRFADRQWRLSVRPQTRLAVKFAVRFSAGGKTPCGWLAFSDLPARAQLERYISLKRIAGVAPVIVAAAVETVAEPLLQSCERALGIDLQIDEVKLAEALKPLAVSAGLRLDWGDGGCDAELACDADLARLLTGYLASHPRPAAAPLDLPLTLRLQLGMLRLPLATLATLRTGDVLLTPLVDPGEVTVRLAPGWFCRARRDASRLTLISRWETEMAEQHPSPSPPSGETAGAAESSAAFDQLEVDLRFDLGAVSISLAELKTVGPGYVFELDRALDRLVTLQVNGQPMGVGELVEVDQRVGVRLVELYGHGDGKSA